MGTDRHFTCEGAPSPDARLVAIMAGYVHPKEVVEDDCRPLADKRAILCFWASDACAVESRPGFRWLPGTPGPIAFDHVIAALGTLDDRWPDTRDLAPYAGATMRKSPAAAHPGT